MTLLETDVIAIVIALVGCLTMMFLFWKQNIELTKENHSLRKENAEMKWNQIKV